MVNTFLSQPLLGRVAYTCLAFIEILVGPRCAQMHVQKPQRYGFDRPALVAAVVQLMVQLGRHRQFLEALPGGCAAGRVMQGQACYFAGGRVLASVLGSWGTHPCPHDPCLHLP